MRRYWKTLLMTLACVSAVAAARAADAPADPYPGLAKYQFGQSRQPLAQVEEEIRKAAPAGYRSIEAKLLPILTSPQTPKDAKRAICRWLAVVGSGECIPAVAELLADADLSHPARIALEARPEPAAGAALRAALPKLKGKLLTGVIGSIGARRDAAALAAIIPLATDGDADVARAALAAIGAIGNEEAAKALAAIQPDDRLARAKARAQIEAASRLATAGNKPAAAVIYGGLMHSSQPQAIRVAALKGVVGTLPQAEAARLVAETIQSADPGVRVATVAAYSASADKSLKQAVAEQLPAMKAAGQLTLLGVLADQADVAARPAVLKVLEAASDAQLRVAALECLAVHGEASDVPLVVRLASADPASVAEAARKALDRMGKPGVDEALVQLIASPKAADRAVVLAALASRRVDAALPVLVRLVGGTDRALATEAARGLAVLGKSEQLTTLGAVLSAAEDGELRRAAADAVKAICARATDKAAAAKALLAALDQAKTPAGRIALLPLLAATRGDDALGAVLHAMKDADADVGETAMRTLVAWPEASAAPHLIELAKSAPRPAIAVLALRDGCLRLANLKELPVAVRLNIYRSVLDAARRPEEKKQAIAGLSELPSAGALDVLLGCTQDAALKDDAVAATIRLAREVGLVYNPQALAALERVKAAANGEQRKQADNAIKALKNAGQTPDGYILAWMLSGPYAQEGKNSAELFDVAFAPEKAGAPAEWRPVAGSRERKGLVEIDKALGGNERVAYLKTRLASDKEQEAQLLLGSDDGVKVWLNGQVVHANNAVRPTTPDQDKVKVRLKAGANQLLLKITQGGGEWTVCCRLRSADGQDLPDVQVAPDGQ